MKIGDYVRTRTGTIGKIININEFREPSMKYGIDFQCADDIIFIGDEHIVKSSSNIIDLLKPMDLIYVDIDNGYAGGIIAPRIAETQAELNLMIDLIKSGKWILKGIVMKEQLDSIRYKVGD